MNPPSPRPQAQLYWNVPQYLTAPLPSSPYRQHTQTLGLQQPSVPNIRGRRKKRAGMSAYGQVGSATCGQWTATSPWILQFNQNKLRYNLKPNFQSITNCCTERLKVTIRAVCTVYRNGGGWSVSGFVRLRCLGMSTWKTREQRLEGWITLRWNVDNNIWRDAGSGACSVTDYGVNSANPAVCFVTALAVVNTLSAKCYCKGGMWQSTIQIPIFNVMGLFAQFRWSIWKCCYRHGL